MGGLQAMVFGHSHRCTMSSADSQYPERQRQALFRASSFGLRVSCSNLRVQGSRNLWVRPVNGSAKLLTTHRSLLTAHRPLLTAHRLPLTACGSLLTAYRLPLTAHRLLLTAHCLRLTVHSHSVRNTLLSRAQPLRGLPSRRSRPSCSQDPCKPQKSVRSRGRGEAEHLQAR